MNKDRSTPQPLDEILRSVRHSGPVPRPWPDHTHPATEEPLPGELETIREGEEEFARGEIRRLDDVQDELGLPTTY